MKLLCDSFCHSFVARLLVALAVYAALIVLWMHSPVTAAGTPLPVTR